MTKENLIGQLRIGKNGTQLLQILDTIVDGMDVCESTQDSRPTLDEIEF